MNANQLINMILRIFLRRAVSTGINKGMRMMERRGPGGRQADAGDRDPDAPQLTQAQRRQMRQARKTARIARRMTRM